MMDIKDRVNTVIRDVESVKDDLCKVSSVILSRRLYNSVSLVNDILFNVRSKIANIVLSVNSIPLTYVDKWIILKQLNMVLSHIDLILDYVKIIASQIERRVISEFRLKREEDYIVKHIEYVIESLNDVLKRL
ncbi:MAG TPA: hypothetical protein EYH40_01015 [Desulfurococcales archaeon]|nr:hypothetical protein [Desulfurococcales archaeon]